MTQLPETPVAGGAGRRAEATRFLLIANGPSLQTTARLLSVLADRLRGQGHIARLRLRSFPGGIGPKVRELLQSEHRHIALLRHVDAVVVHSPLALCLPTLMAARLLRRPVLSFIWDLHPESNRVTGTIRNPVVLILFWLLERLGLLLSSRLLISSEDYRPFLGRFGLTADVIPLWPCDPIAEVPPLRGSNDSTLRIGFAGQINAIRGIGEGIGQVLNGWQGERVELHLFSTDRCPDDLAHRASADPRLRIVEHGFVDPAQLQGRLTELDLGWVCLDPALPLPAFPSKALAYLCAGLPVLYTGPQLPALRRWLDVHRLGVATSSGKVFGRRELEDLRSGLRHRRGAYFDEISGLWGNLGRLL